MKKLALAGLFIYALCFTNCVNYAVIDSANVDGKILVSVVRTQPFVPAEGYIAKCDADATGNLKCKRVRMDVTN